MEIWKENRQTQSYSIVSHANACSCNGIFLSMCPVGNVRWHVFFLGFHKFKQEVFNTIENYCDRHPTQTQILTWTLTQQNDQRIKIQIEVSTNFPDSIYLQWPTL